MTDCPEGTACRAGMRGEWDVVAAFLRERDLGERVREFFDATPHIAVYRTDLALAAATSYHLERGDLDVLAARWRETLSIVRERGRGEDLGNFRERLRGSVMVYCRLHDRSYEENLYGV